MNISWKGWVGGIVVLIIVFCVGGYSGIRVAAHYDEEMLHELLLSQSSLDTTRAVVLLTNLREGKTDRATKFLETNLDTALINIAGEYSIKRDGYGMTANSLCRAREYRMNYPHKSLIAWRDQRVENALRTSAGSTEIAK